MYYIRDMTKFYKIVEENAFSGKPATYFFKHNDDGVWIKSTVSAFENWVYYDIELQDTETYIPVTTEEYNQLVLEEI